jgi:glycosyltransferase involved in cell wall biosynthesis
MRCDILCNDGSPLSCLYDDLWGLDGRVGIGGSELALFTLCEQLSKEGDTVRLYNDPRHPSSNPYFEQLPLAAFSPSADRDVLIIFRSPNERSLSANCKKVWWSCDPQTVGDFRIFSKTVDKIVCISEFHKQKFEARYGITTAQVIDIPIRVSDYDKHLPKIPHRVLFSSVPDRGLVHLEGIWPIIKDNVPDAELTVTSDYRLWGTGALNEAHRLRYARQKGVRFLGAVPRQHLIEEQLCASVLAYPCSFEELFCISVAEAEVAGCATITSEMGALPTTNMYQTIPGVIDSPLWKRDFAEAVIAELLTPNLDRREEIRKRARERFDPVNIAKIWKETIL